MISYTQKDIIALAEQNIRMDGVTNMSTMFVLGTGISFKVLLIIAIITIVLFMIVFMIKIPQDNQSKVSIQKTIVGLTGILSIIILSVFFTVDNTTWQNEINKKKAIDEAYNKISENDDSSYHKYEKEQFETIIDR